MSVIGQIAGAAGGKAAADKASKSSRHAIAPTYFDSVLQEIETLLLPYEELVRLGKVVPGSDLPGGSFYGLERGQSRLGRAIEAYQDTLAAGDPTFAAYRGEIGRIAGDLEQGGLPADDARRIRESVRASQASRGIIDSPIAGVQEAVELLGGEEAVRQRRLGMLRDYIGGVTTSSISALFPGASGLLEAALARAGIRTQGIGIAAGTGASIYGSAASSSSTIGQGLG